MEHYTSVNSIPQWSPVKQNNEKIIPASGYERDGYKGVDYANLVLLLTEGINEQQQQIDKLKKQVEKLIKK
ncbi:MAG: hypothetical protein ACHQFX_00870 [Chitinophagales bacterium]